MNGNKNKEKSISELNAVYLTTKRPLKIKNGQHYGYGAQDE